MDPSSVAAGLPRLGAAESGLEELGLGRLGGLLEFQRDGDVALRFRPLDVLLDLPHVAEDVSAAALRRTREPVAHLRS